MANETQKKYLRYEEDKDAKGNVISSGTKLIFQSNCRSCNNERPYRTDSKRDREVEII